MNKYEVIGLIGEGIFHTEIYRPDLVTVKVNFEKCDSFYCKSDVFKKAQKVAKYLDYFCAKIFGPELSQIDQSGHTDCELPKISTF